jgi:hypothetical protein
MPEGIRRELETAHGHLERNANPKVLFMDLSYRMMGLLAGDGGGLSTRSGTPRRLSSHLAQLT